MKRLPWLAALVVTTIVFGTIYATTQQVLRRDANDPQIQIAEDAAASLDKGAKPALVVRGEVNLSSSLASAVIVYDKNGSPVAGSARLANKLPKIPKGVLLASDGRPYNALTWQPDANVRLASVTVSARDYYVTAVRSLREVEVRENHMFLLAGAGWAVSVFAIVVAFAVSSKFRRG